MTLNCPNCSNPMQEIREHGVHLDYCSVCKGIWLDRGEIDKIISSSGKQEVQSTDAVHDYEFRKILAELRSEGRIV